MCNYCFEVLDADTYVDSLFDVEFFEVQCINVYGRLERLLEDLFLLSEGTQVERHNINTRSEMELN